MDEKGETPATADRTKENAQETLCRSNPQIQQAKSNLAGPKNAPTPDQEIKPAYSDSTGRSVCPCIKTTARSAG